MSTQEVAKVTALYMKDGQIGAVPVVSTTFGPNGRRLSLGQLANGDVIEVPVPDVIARPDLFLAPCGKPYVIKGMTVENPCEELVEDLGDLEVDDSWLESVPAPPLLEDERKKIKEIVGSDKAVAALEEAGYVTSGAVLGLAGSDMGMEELKELVGVKAASSVSRHLNPTPKKVAAKKPATRAKKTTKASDKGE